MGNSMFLFLLLIATGLCDYLPEAVKEDPEGEPEEAEQNKTAEPPPSMYLVQPYERNGTEGANSSVYPCGGLPKGKTHLLITPGSYSIIQWRTVKSSPSGMCAVRLSHGIANESTFVTLHPRDKSSNSEGFFECGRYSGMYETKEFGFPGNLSCDTCTLQLVWESPEFKQYYCTDITIMSDEVKYCMGSCLNGGSCVNGNCVCEEPYYGKFCENKEKKSIPVGKMWIFYILLSALIGVLCFAIYKTWPKTVKGPVIVQAGEKQSVRAIVDEMGDNQPAVGVNRDKHGDYQNVESRWLNEHAAYTPEDEEFKGDGEHKTPFEDIGQADEDRGGPDKFVRTITKYPEGKIEETPEEKEAEHSEVAKSEGESIGDLKHGLASGLIDDFE